MQDIVFLLNNTRERRKGYSRFYWTFVPEKKYDYTKKASRRLFFRRLTHENMNTKTPIRLTINIAVCLMPLSF